MDFDAFVRWRKFLKPFFPNAPFLYPLKTTENLSDILCFQGVAKGCIGIKWVNSRQNIQDRKDSHHYLSLCYMLVFIPSLLPESRTHEHFTLS